MQAADSYVGKPGEPIYLEDREVFAVCDKKSSGRERVYYKTNRGKPVLPDDLEAQPAAYDAIFLKENSRRRANARVCC
ncbi:hypothetical protein [Borrelia sp. P9F1]|uniref:hypothetical protein n=1 Tax=Borrelia sp. P9F1 TaxID=3058374 RepID=UPI002647DF60|nr:hypothetical protein [Borrelia sp. P9F1]WKC58523.1 hypothetical protein QYZ68_04710 [Borrelia sp. P9F1]